MLPVLLLCSLLRCSFFELSRNSGFNLFSLLGVGLRTDVLENGGARLEFFALPLLSRVLDLSAAFGFTKDYMNSLNASLSFIIFLIFVSKRNGVNLDMYSATASRHPIRSLNSDWGRRE